ncbi:BQ2448_7012 [Microbotryum intermedium]|uniref:BQ2448_7012 protein n=1 Tax=Microbotryum intermedium TaxID=269621 RepID=A0A238FIL9_9BASI|nr:BQ2448_7012 [Microbotryum intermedium]
MVSRCLHSAASNLYGTNLLGAESRRLKLKCNGVSWPCRSCVKRGFKDLCPNGTLAPGGCKLKTIEERNTLRRRTDLV